MFLTQVTIVAPVAIFSPADAAPVTPLIKIPDLNPEHAPSRAPCHPPDIPPQITPITAPEAPPAMAPESAAPPVQTVPAGIQYVHHVALEIGDVGLGLPMAS